MPAAFLHPYAKPTQDRFIRIERGEGALVWDEDGRELVDGMASLWYNAIGHGRAEMADVIADQVRKLGAYSTFDPFTNEPAETLAEELRQIGPTPNARVFFTSSGSESIDTVMKLARMAHVQAGQPQRKLIISRTRGYHGVAYGGTSALGIAAYKDNFGPFVDEVVQVPAEDIEAVATLMSQRGNEVAAIMTEPVQGAGGVFPPPDGYLQSLRKLCDQHGAYLIFDEVITGYGRTGSWFAAHHYGVSPDFATFAKGITSGYIPLGGVFVGIAPTAALETDPNFFLTPRLHLLRPSHRVCRRAEEPGDHPPRGPGRAGQAHRRPVGWRPARPGRRRRDRRRPRRGRHVGPRSATRPGRQGDARPHAQHEPRDRSRPRRRPGDVPTAGDPRRAHRSAGRRGRCGGRLR